MNFNIFIGIMIPLLGTTLGAGCVYFLKDKMSTHVQKILLGFAAGVMIAASVWSLLIPAIEASEHLGKLSFFPAAIGFLLGMGTLLLIDQFVPHLHLDSDEPEGQKSNLPKSSLLFLAVTIHNIPEGMAVGAAFLGVLSDNVAITMASAFALSIGIAIQNFPEGAIISMPLHSTGGLSKHKAFLYALGSGVVEPIGALLVLSLKDIMLPLLPYTLAFAAGAMIYVVIEELIPEASQGEHSNIATIGFAFGFVLMMILDVAL